MKVKFSANVPYTPEWNGNRQLPEKEQIKSILKPMEFDDLMSFFDAIGGSKVAVELKEQISSGNVDVVKERVDFTKVIQQVGSLVPKYATIENLEGDDGPLTVEAIARYPRFMELIIELLSKLSEISSPSEETEGNSEGQPA